MKSRKKKTQPRPPTLSRCFLQRAAEETSWAAECAKECEYQAAANAIMRRDVWLMAALIARERKL